LEAYSKWAPPESTTYHQFLGRVDSGGGYAVIETENPADIAETTAKFATFADWQVQPVLDIEDAVELATAAIKFRESIG
jgi:hypothetical protein